MKRIDTLKDKSQISHIFDTGKNLNIFPFYVKYVESSDTKTLFTIPKKKINKANKRNLIKRRCKAVFNSFANYEHFNIVFVYNSDEVLDYNTIKKSLIKIFKKLENG